MQSFLQKYEIYRVAAWKHISEDSLIGQIIKNERSYIYKLN
jgi:hypothetical protein